MRFFNTQLLSCSWLCLALPATAATHYVNGSNTTPAAPYTSWSTAATKIQDAASAAKAGDDVVVTNGVYGPDRWSVMAGLNNTLVVTQAITVRSVNGPSVTTIQGRPGSFTDRFPTSSYATRCVYLTNGAALIGFTLTNGHTMYPYASYGSTNGGGVWSLSPNTLVSNCVFSGNWASGLGGGAYSGTLVNCAFISNSAGWGGAAASNNLINCTFLNNSAAGGAATYAAGLANCALSGNWATSEGGGVLYGSLTNCTLIDNQAWYIGGGASQSTLKNCIVFANRSPNASNYYSCSLSYTCTMPAADGAGNLAAAPQLASLSHLSAQSPCRNAGSAAYSTGVDIDGEPWASSPSIGCDELYEQVPTGPLNVGIQADYTNIASGFPAGFAANITGHVGTTVWDFGDGSRITNAAFLTHAWTTPGDYLVLLSAYNNTFSEGVSSALTVHVTVDTVYVALNSQSPAVPYSTWATAATNIQNAADAASPGALILVSNGVYQTGQRTAPGDTFPSPLNNRVVIATPLTVRSVNGPGKTIIQGAGPKGQVRCVYLAAGASLEGFTLTNGGTLMYDGVPDLEIGGAGAYCESLTSVVSNCIISSNTATSYGGGAYSGTLINCTLVGNTVTLSAYPCGGGGAYDSVLNNCSLLTNSAFWGGGAFGGILSNCVLTGNVALNGGGGAASNVLNSCTLNFNSATNFGGGAYQATLNGCVLNGNKALYGGGANLGTLTNCILTNNVATSSGGGACSNTLASCTLVGNSAPSYGGGAYYGLLTNCILKGNSASNSYGNGGGAAYGILKNCTLTGNYAAFNGGGAAYATLLNCALSANSAGFSAGGVYFGGLTNCTLVGNSASSYTGGAANATLENCIIFANRDAYSDNSNCGGCSLDYCCTQPTASGTGNLTVDPQLASTSHLSSSSPCIGAGNPSGATGVDIDGKPWANPPSIGCDEYVAGAISGPLCVSIQADYAPGTNGLSMVFWGSIAGEVSTSIWDLGDGTWMTNMPSLLHTWTNAGNYTVVLTAYNDTYPTGVCATLPLSLAGCKRHFVVSANPSPTAPYTTWATAASNIQDAIDTAALGEEVIVTNGVYASGGRVIPSYGALTNRVAITKPITVRSFNGPLSTQIQGYQVPGTTNGNSAIRCVYLTNGAVLVGFTLTNGATRTSGDNYREESGGGVWSVAPSTLISNCIITANSAYFGGGGTYSGTCVNSTLCYNSSQAGGGAYSTTISGCMFISNTAYNGGGAYSSSLTNCLVYRNSSTSGGGVYSSILNCCTLTSNTAYNGGGAYSSSLTNCLLTGNSATIQGGSADYGGLFNCLLQNNLAENGAGASGALLCNCTVVSNLATWGAGGVEHSSIYNSIVYHNISGPVSSNSYSCMLDHCCTIPLFSSGAGNFTNEPLLINMANGDLHLQAGSPCINAGANKYAPGPIDLDGNPRIVGGTVDVGAYEFQSPASRLSYAWLKQYNLPIDGSADNLDSDGDGLSNWQEWMAGTDPTQANSTLRMLQATNSASGLNVTWSSVSTRTYSLLRSTNLAAPPTFSVLCTNISGLDGATTFTDTNASGTGTFFYRVRVEQ